MSYPPPYPQQPYAPPAPVPPSRKRRRVFLWVFLAVQVLFVIWVIAGAASGHPDAVAYCRAHPDPYISYSDCLSLHGAGTAIGVGLVIAFWAVVDIILGVGYGVYKLARRPA